MYWTKKFWKIFLLYVIGYKIPQCTYLNTGHVKYRTELILIYFKILKEKLNFIIKVTECYMSRNKTKTKNNLSVSYSKIFWCKSFL